MKHDPIARHPSALEYLLRITRYARNSDDAARRVAFESPTVIASDWSQALIAAEMLLAVSLETVEFTKQDTFGVHFLAGYARLCGRADVAGPLQRLADRMWTVLDARWRVDRGGLGGGGRGLAGLMSAESLAEHAVHEAISERAIEVERLRMDAEWRKVARRREGKAGMVRPEDELENLRRENANLRRQLESQRANNEQRNRLLDALGIVWCSGGCEGGMLRYHPDREVTAQMVADLIVNARRAVKWYRSHVAYQAAKASPDRPFTIDDFGAAARKANEEIRTLLPPMYRDDEAVAPIRVTFADLRAAHRTLVLRGGLDRSHLSDAVWRAAVYEQAQQRESTPRHM